MPSTRGQNGTLQARKSRSAEDWIGAICATQKKKARFVLFTVFSKRLDWHCLCYPGKDWISAICAIQQKTGLALSALYSNRQDLRYLRYPAKDWISAICATQQRLDWSYLHYPAKDWICGICTVQQKTGLALSLLSSKRLD